VPGYALAAGKRRGVGFSCLLVAPEQQRHDQPDADAEAQRQHHARKCELGPQRDAGVGQRQYVACRGEEQKRDRWPQPRPLAVDAGKQRLHRTRTHREQAARSRSRRVGKPARRVRPEKTHDGLLRHQRGQAARDEKCRHETQQYVRREIRSQTCDAALQGCDHRFHDFPAATAAGHPNSDTMQGSAAGRRITCARSNDNHAALRRVPAPLPSNQSSGIP
jgi:hypothetical protein